MTADRQQIIREFIQQAKELLQGRVSKIILYGSCAREEDKETSDIDLMFLTPLTDKEISRVEDELYDLSYKFFMKYFVDISVIMKNEEHFYHWVNDLPFAKGGDNGLWQHVNDVGWIRA